MHVLDIETGLYEKYEETNKDHQGKTRVSIKKSNQGDAKELSFDDIFMVGRVVWPEPLPYLYHGCTPKEDDICLLGNGVLKVFENGDSINTMLAVYRRSGTVYGMSAREVVSKVLSVSVGVQQRMTGLLALCGYSMVYGVGIGPILQFSYESNKRKSAKVKIIIKPERDEVIIINSSNKNESAPPRVWADALLGAVQSANNMGFKARRSDDYYHVDIVFPEHESNKSMTYINLSINDVRSGTIKINPRGNISPSLMRIDFAQATWLAEEFESNKDLYEVMANHDDEKAVFSYHRIVDANNSYYLR